MGIKKSIIRLNNIKRNFYLKYKDKILDLRKQRNTAISGKQKIDLNIKLQKFNRYAYVSQHRRRCLLSGRSRGVINRYGLCRMKLLEYGAKGYISGLKKG